ncbi:MAG TPA: trypsin-like serine protease, partial [Candidatus Limnocylindrales bacterium]
MTRLRNALLAVAALLLLTASPAAAITYGTPDGNDHPYVGFMIFFVPSEPGWFSCSGTLLDSTTFLTAGHCTVDIGTNGDESASRSGGNDAWVTFRSDDVLAGWPLRADHPDATEQQIYDLRSAWLNDASHGFVRGTAHPDPLYDDFASYPVNNDLGIVKLASAASGQAFGALAPIGTAERLVDTAKNKNGALIETVGYGIQSVQPNPLSVDTRYWSTSRIVELNGNASKGGNLHTLNNPSEVGGRGGSCNGDSGGPLLVPGTNQVVAVVSYGFSGTCHGADYSWRVDTVPSQQ